MYMPFDGMLESQRLVRGDAAVLEAFVDEICAEVLASEERVAIGLNPEVEICIAYGDAKQEARASKLKAMINERLPSAGVYLKRIGPVVGSHTGGTVLAPFYFAKTR